MYSNLKKNEKMKKKEKKNQDYKKAETIKKQSEKLYFSKLILKDKNNIKITWHVIKEAIQKKPT